MAYEIFVLRHGDAIGIAGEVEASSESEAEMFAGLMFGCDWNANESLEAQVKHDANRPAPRSQRTA